MIVIGPCVTSRERTPLHRRRRGGAAPAGPDARRSDRSGRRDLLPEAADRGLEHLGPGVVEHDLVGPLALLIERAAGPARGLPGPTRSSLAPRPRGRAAVRGGHRRRRPGRRAYPSPPPARPPRRARPPAPSPGGPSARSPARTSGASIGWRIVSRSHRAEGWAKTISPRARRSIVRRLVGARRTARAPRCRTARRPARAPASGRAGHGPRRRRRARRPRAGPAPRPPGSCRRRCRRSGR